VVSDFIYIELRKEDNVANFHANPMENPPSRSATLSMTLWKSIDISGADNITNM
jgi:hypothetical protein